MPSTTLRQCLNLPKWPLCASRAAALVANMIACHAVQT